MASMAERSLLVFLSSLLLSGVHSFPSLRLLFQGVAGDHQKMRGLYAESPLVAAGRWEWRTTGEADHESTLLPRRKRDIAPPTKSNLSAVTLLDDETTQPSVEHTTEPLWEDETSQPGLAGNNLSTGVTSTSNSHTDMSTEAAVVHLSTVRYKAPLHGQTTTASLSEDFTETGGTEEDSRPSHAIDTTRPNSTVPSQALVATSTTSVAASRPDSTSGVKTVGGTSSSLSPPTASSRPSSTVQVRPPPREALPGPDKMVGQCLLAISLLALVAAIFIITTFVLAALLLRQKRAYKLRQRNHTEMVCISSLLAAEEAEASRGRGPRTKRGKTLADNGSETDMDNLTLNSFLPDH